MPSTKSPFTEQPQPASILIVEDEQIVALELEDRLTRMGHRVVGVVVSGEEAVVEAKRLRPDLILMDIKLRGQLDGIDAAAIIRKELDPAIVYLTAFDDNETLQRAKLTQPSGYILKPFQARELYIIIEVALYRGFAERALREGELWRLALLRSVGDAVVASDEGGRVEFMNPIAEALTGWSEAEAIGTAFDAVFRTVERPERRKGTWDAATTNLIAKDGTEHPIEFDLTPIRAANGHQEPMGIVCVFRDISERRRVRDRLSFLTVASSTLSSSLDLDLVLTQITSLIARDLSDWCAVHLADARGRLRVGAFAHRDAATHATLAQLTGAMVRDQAETVLEDVARSRRSLRVNAPAHDWSIHALGIETPLAATAVLVVPMIFRGRCLGTLTVACNQEGHVFDQGDLELGEELARRIASSIDNAQLYADAQRSTAMRDDVLAVVSHDLRNPLAAITMGAEQLLEPAIAPNRIVRNASLIQRNAERMERLIDDLLDVGRVDSGRLSIEPERVPARALVRDALANFEGLAAGELDPARQCADCRRRSPV